MSAQQKVSLLRRDSLCRCLTDQPSYDCFFDDNNVLILDRIVQSAQGRTFLLHYVVNSSEVDVEVVKLLALPFTNDLRQGKKFLD